MKHAPRTNKRETPLFTVDEHLRVQMQIERRAYELWRARGCRQDGVLDNWLQAEGEVLEEFIAAYRNRQRPLSTPRKLVNDSEPSLRRAADKAR